MHIQIHTIFSIYIVFKTGFQWVALFLITVYLKL